VEGGSELTIRAKPRASRSAVLGVRSANQRAFLEVRLAAPPVEGAANAELLDVLAQALRIPRRDLELTRGAAGRMKRVRISGLSPDQVLARLSP
jgi:uncharacterized protein